MALSTGRAGPSWGRLGAVLRHLGRRLGAIPGHLGAVLLLHLKLAFESMKPASKDRRSEIQIKEIFEGCCKFRRSSELHVDEVSSRHWAGELGMG